LRNTRDTRVRKIHKIHLGFLTHASSELDDAKSAEKKGRRIL